MGRNLLQAVYKRVIFKLQDAEERHREWARHVKELKEAQRAKAVAKRELENSAEYWANGPTEERSYFDVPCAKMGSEDYSKQ